ncbi:MAG: AAA family ATPase [Candidatus Scalindua sp.]|jgi:DNA repair protein SbcC/Rad50|nr:AAA family ATPase [Candidatus Scalindua sp.]
MIKQLTIENFQAHKKTELSFDDGINVIIGQSDSGKSAIIRALNWVINNKPSGEAFRSKWGGDTKVILGIGSESIERAKYKDNIYCVHSDERDMVYRSFGQSVPTEVKELLNFSSLNIANQFDSPFLLAMSGGEVASYLNNIVNLDKIDISLANINKTLKDEKTVCARVKSELEATQIRYAGFDYLEKAEASLIEIEALEEERIERVTKVNLNKTIVESIKNCQKELKKYSGVVDCKKEIDSIERELKELDEKKEKLEDLKATASTLTDIQTDIIYQKMKRDLDKEEFEKLMPEQCPLCGRGD